MRRSRLLEDIFKKLKTRAVGTLIGSALIHALVFVLVAYGIAPLTQKHAKPDQLEDHLVAIEFLEELAGTHSESQSPRLGQENAERTEKRAPLGTDASQNARNHSQTLDFSLRSQKAIESNWLRDHTADPTDTGANDFSKRDRMESQDPGSELGHAGHGWSRGVQYGQGMNLAFTNENLGFFQALHRRIDGALVYHEDFVKARMRGKVRVEATISKDGRLIDFSALEADNDVLHAYVLAYLIQALKAPLPERHHLSTDQAVVVFDFDFRIRIEGSTSVELLTGVMKNHLAFGREGIVDPILNEKIHELFTHYVPPIIPIPGGFYVDLILAYQYVKNIVEDAPLESEARQARIRALKESLIQTIHSEKKDRPPES